MIRSVRGMRVMLDSDLARIYRVETRALVQAVKRNRDRFPSDFVIELSAAEWESLRSQTVISKAKGGRRYRPYAFTELCFVAITDRPITAAPSALVCPLARESFRV